jgi:sigma-B regulation protein RsbU (phosphoserine phosphatase)
MANFQANIRALAVRSNHLDQLVSELNGKVLESAKGEKFITFFIAKYNSVSRELKYVNAGHNPPLLRSNSGIQILDKGCTGLGIVDQLEVIETGIIEIFPDSFLFCYTDGLVEQENEGGKDFGIELLSKILKENTTLSADEFNNLLAEVISSYKGDKPFLDDIAMLSCRFF